MLLKNAAVFENSSGLFHKVHAIKFDEKRSVWMAEYLPAAHQGKVTKEVLKIAPVEKVWEWHRRWLKKMCETQAGGGKASGSKAGSSKASTR